MRLHIDTDFGDNPDDACALAMVLGWPGAEITAVTTAADPDGRRAGEVERFLGLLGAHDIPVASGGAWARPLLEHSIDAGAALVALGPYTNLADLARVHPRALERVAVFTMGGWVDAFGDGYPAWGPERDRNVQRDTDAARALFDSAADLTLVPCASAVAACLRTTDLPRLSASGPAGALLARQVSTHGQDHGYSDLGRGHAALPDDLVTVLWDPVTCAAALGWTGASVHEERLRPEQDAGLLRFVRDPSGRRTRVLDPVDGDALVAVWLSAVEAAQRLAP